MFFSGEERKKAIKERIKKIKFKIIYTDKEEKKTILILLFLDLFLRISFR